MRALPLPARLYVGATIALGATLVVWLGPRSTFDNIPLFVVLLLASAVTSAFKVSLPLAKSGSTMSVSYAVDFASLLLLGPNETMLVAVDERVEPVHVPDEDQEPGLPDAVQHGVPRHHRAGLRLRLRIARRRARHARARLCPASPGRSSAPRRCISSSTPA